MIARLENGFINVYNEKDILVGGIKIQKNFKKAEIKIGEKEFQLSRNRWETKILEKDNVICHLKMNSFSGNTTIRETDHKITGVFGFKWGAKMMDKENNTLLKIRNENHFTNRNKYEIEISNEKVTDLDILMILYSHLYGSNMKLMLLIIAISSTVSSGLVLSGIL